MFACLFYIKCKANNHNSHRPTIERDNQSFTFMLNTYISKSVSKIHWKHISEAQFCASSLNMDIPMNSSLQLSKMFRVTIVQNIYGKLHSGDVIGTINDGINYYLT